MDAQTILGTLAQVSATLIGFIGVIFAIGRFSSGGLETAERNALIHLMLPATAALILALLPMVLSAGLETGIEFWRSANGLLGAIHLLLVADATRNTLRGRLPEPLSLQLAMCFVGYISVAANFGVMFGFFQDLGLLIYAIGLWWLLVVSVVEFIILILSHANDT